MIRDIRAPLRAFLLADSAVYAKVGARVFPTIVPQGIRAVCLVYNTVTALGDHHMQGASGYAVKRMQVAAWSALQDEAEDVANLVKFRLDGFRGIMASATSPAAFPPVRVQGVFFDAENPPIFDEARKLYGIGKDYMIHYVER